MGEKYYLVSKEELKRAFNAAYETGLNDGNSGPLDELEKALASCTSRPVPEWTTHFALFDVEEMRLMLTEEIKK